MLLLTSTGIWFVPITCIGMDVNPSIELKVNVLDRVIGQNGKNSDSITLEAGIDVTGMFCDKAIQRILLSNSLELYLEQRSTITITVAGGNDAHSEGMLSKVLCRAITLQRKKMLSTIR